jgi:hypothetical protein
MANEAAVTIIGRMRDEISGQMNALSKSTNEAAISTAALGEESDFTSDSLQVLTNKSLEATVQTFQLNLALTAMGSALTAVGSLIGKLDNPTARMASNFLLVSGAILTTVSSIVQTLPYIKQLTESLRNLAIVQTVLKALSGPAGWITLGIGAAVGIGAGYAISKATSTPESSGVTVNNYIQGSVVTEKKIAQTTRREIIELQNRNGGTSGIK